MHHSEKLFKLSTLALCLAALPQAAQAAEEVQQAEVEQVTVVGKNKSLRTEIKTATQYPPCAQPQGWFSLRGKFPNPSVSLLKNKLKTKASPT